MSAGVLAGRRSALACSAGEARIRRPQPERKSGIGADPARARQQLAKGRAQVWRGASEALSKSVTSKNPTLSKAPLDLLGETKLLNLRHLQIGPTERNTTVFLSPLFSTTFNATLVTPPLESSRLRDQLAARVTGVRRGEAVEAERCAQYMCTFATVVLADVDR